MTNPQRVEATLRAQKNNTRRLLPRLSLSTTTRSEYRLSGDRVKRRVTVGFNPWRLMAKKRKRKGFCTVYRHWRTGKLMYAKAYGYKAWPFGR